MLDAGPAGKIPINGVESVAGAGVERQLEKRLRLLQAERVGQIARVKSVKQEQIDHLPGDTPMPRSSWEREAQTVGSLVQAGAELGFARRSENAQIDLRKKAFRRL